MLAAARPLLWSTRIERHGQGSESKMVEHHHTILILAQALSNTWWNNYDLTLARRCRHVSQARDVYFLPGRLRLAGSSGAVGIAEVYGKEEFDPVHSRL